MTTRRFCYKHHCQKIALLPEHDLYRANDWEIVPPEGCELCATEEQSDEPMEPDVDTPFDSWP